MLKFDKMKLVTKIDYISDIDYSKFILNSKEDSILYYKYQQERPFYLLVMVNYQHNELVLEFTGKIINLPILYIDNKRAFYFNR